MENVAILWDIENVTPKANSQFVEGLIEFTEELGKLTVCRVYGNWTKTNLGRLSRRLSESGFELIHIPNSKKNSADISLITNTVELIYQYPHITTIVLITGDADFRPLLHTLRRNGKDIHIICNSSNASEELLSLADSFKDYREIIPGEAAEEAEEAELNKHKNSKVSRGQQDTDSGKVHKVSSTSEKQPSVETAFRLLVEAVQKMEKNKKKPGMGAVKVKLKILNPYFDEKNYGFKSWIDFVYKARNEGFISINEEEQSLYLASCETANAGSSQKSPLAEAFDALISVLDELIADEKKGKDSYPLALIGSRLSDRVDYAALGYKRLKDFIFSAEKRDLVDVEFENGSYYVKKK